MGWRVVHYDWTRDMYTLERTRWWLKGAYRVMSGRELFAATFGGLE